MSLFVMADSPSGRELFLTDGAARSRPAVAQEMEAD